jgi:hypothetical protein
MNSISLKDWLLGMLPMFALILVWLIPMLVALLRLSKRTLDETAKAVWVLVIVILPVIGPLAFLMVSGSTQKQ